MRKREGECVCVGGFDGKKGRQCHLICMRILILNLKVNVAPLQRTGVLLVTITCIAIIFMMALVVTIIILQNESRSI